MNVVGFDAKSILRDLVKRGPGGEVERQKGMGFNTHLGTAVFVNDYESAAAALQTSFQTHAEDFGINLRTPFISAQRLRQLFFPEWQQRASLVAFLHQVVADVLDFVDHARFTWLLLPRSDDRFRIRGGKYPREMDWHQFHGTVQTFGAMLAAADYAKHGENADEFHVDHFESRFNFAWKDLVDNGTPTRIVAHGDEVNASICLADLIGFLTHHTIDVNRENVTKSTLTGAWESKGLTSSARYWTRDHLPWIEWRSKDLVPTSTYYPRPMTFALMDQQFGMNPGLKSDEPVRNALEAQPLVDVPLAHAALHHGGFKFWAGKKDLSSIKDGDDLVYIGTESKMLAENLQTAFDVRVRSLAEMRQDVARIWAPLAG